MGSEGTVESETEWATVLDFGLPTPLLSPHIPMKVKSIPNDFVVDEIAEPTLRPGGQFALYRLTKTGLTTPDAIDALCRRLRVPRDRVAYGGLKDRHAVTSQHVTVANGPVRGWRDERTTLEYLGRVDEPFRSDGIVANRFDVTVRDLSPEEVARAAVAADDAPRSGVGNYFDDQRFGSVGPDGRFIAKCWVQGDWEGGLRLALTGPYSHDRPDAKREKAALRAHWGDWSACLTHAGRGPARPALEHLARNADDFRGACGRLRPDLGELYLSAYQSHLWNRTAHLWLEANVDASARSPVRLKLGNVWMPNNLSDSDAERLLALTLPFLSSRTEWDDAAPWAAAATAVLAAEGLELGHIRLNGLRRPYFARGERPALYRPAEFEWDDAEDERHPKRRRMRLRFRLPRGCYATMLVKRLFGEGEL